MKKNQEKPFRGNWIFSLCAFVALSVLFTALSVCHWPMNQFCDETDAYAAAMVIADGGSLYTHYITQHMPGQSYLCALFRLLGADSVLDYRIGFFSCLGLLWAGMYLRYRKWYGNLPMILYPVGYLAVMSLFGIHSSVPLAEHVAAQGAAILLLEMLHFLHNGRRLSGASYVWIGAGVGLCFCFLFMSAYQIAAVALTVLLAQLFALPKYIAARKAGETPNEGKGLNFRRTLLLIVCCALPVIIMVGLFAATGHLENFYDQAYEFNRKVYPRYTGMGKDAFSVLPMAVVYLASWLVNAIPGALNGDLLSLVYVSCVIANAWTLVCVGRKSGLAAAGTAVLLLVSGIRGFDSFHSISYYGLTMLLLLVCIREEARLPQRTAPALAAVLAVIIMLPYMQLFNQFGNWRSQETPHHVSQAIQKITDEDDRIVVMNLDWGICVGADRTPLCMGVAGLPWYNDAYGYRERQVIINERPKVIVCDMNLNVWGHNFTQYGQRTILHINTHYTPLENYPTIYVLDEYLETAYERLNTH